VQTIHCSSGVPRAFFRELRAVGIRR